MKLQKLTNSIYFLPAESHVDRPVLGIVKGKNFSLNIDCGNSKAHAELFLSEVNKLNFPPLKYSVITHWHWDHVFGMECFDNQIISSERTQNGIRNLKDLKWGDAALELRVKEGQEIEFCREHILKEFPDENKRNIQIKLADQNFENEMTIDLGDCVVQLKEVKADHSEDNTLVLIESEKTVFLGDSLYMDMYHGAWSYSPKLFVKYTTYLKELNYVHYVASHQPVLSYRDIQLLNETAVYLYELVFIQDFDEAKLRAQTEKSKYKNCLFFEDLVVGYINYLKKD